MDCKVLKNKKCQITQNYSDNHKAVDVVGINSTLDYIVAHTSGKIVEIQDGIGNMKGSVGRIAYGNYVKINHGNNYYTLYAHLQNNLPVRINQSIKEGEIIGYMGDSGNAYGKHLHFEVFKGNTKINPTEFLNKELPINNQNNNTNENTNNNQNTNLKYKIGDRVEINGVYISSTSKEKLRPLITNGTITKIIENANNPYLLDNGKIGWVNDQTIINNQSTQNTNYLSNKTYTGTSIVDALKEINIDSSYNNRKEIAKKNNITNYKGTYYQNIELLNLLKQGLLKY